MSIVSNPLYIDIYTSRLECYSSEREVRSVQTSLSYSIESWDSSGFPRPFLDYEPIPNDYWGVYHLVIPRGHGLHVNAGSSETVHGLGHVEHAKGLELAAR